MAKQNNVVKIYQLKTLGYADITKQLDGVAKRFEAIKKAKLSIEGKKALTDDIVQVQRYSKEIEDLILQEQQLRVETQKLTNEQKALQLQRQAEINQQRTKINLNTAEEGSIAKIRAAIKELTALTIVKNKNTSATIDFRGQLLTYDQAIEKLKQLTAAEQDFRRQFQKDGTLVAEYTTGIVDAFRKMGLSDLVGAQITETKKKVDELNSEFNELQKELEETKKAGQSTKTIEKQMIDNRNEVIKLDTEVARLRADLRGTGDVGSQITTSISNGFKSIKGQVGSLILQYAGLSALISKTQQGVSEAKLASDQATDLEIQLDNSAAAAQKLITGLKGLDTRTTLTGLEQIADVALKAGVTAENIESVTRAVDITKVAFGKDFGSIEQGTETFAKLINIFFEDRQITGDRILQIGNSIRTLANETVASVPFLTDFSARMAGVKQIANVTLPDILGLGAGFEEFKQSAEVSSTVLVKIIPKLASDVDKFAKIAGLTKQQFSDLLNNNPIEALLKVSEALVKSGKGIEEVSEALKDSELGSGRITTIIATLGGKADVFRERIAKAGVAIQDTGAITEAFNKKNNNLAASIDKINKKIQDAFAGRTFQTIVLAVTTVFGFLLTNLPIILGLLGLLTVSWLVQSQAVLLLRARVLLYNLAIGANTILINALRIANLAYTAGLLVFNGALKLVTATMRLFGITTTAATGPLGVIIALVGTLAAVFLGLSKAMAGTSNVLRDQNLKMRAMNEINQAATKIFTAQIAEIDSWMKVIRASTTSADTKRFALEKLVSINKEFSKALKDNTVDLDEVEKAYGRVTAAIKAQATAQASADLTAKKQQRLVEITSLRREIEIRLAQGKGDILFEPDEITKAQTEVLERLKGVSKNRLLTSPGKKTFGLTVADMPKVLNQLKLVEEEANKEFQVYLEAKTKADKDVEQFLKDGVVTAKSFEVDVEDLRARIEALDKEINVFKGSKADLDKKVAERKKLQDELDRLLGQDQKSGSGFRGSRISGEDRDKFKDIDSVRDDQLKNQESKFIQLQIDEERYLKNVFAINVQAIDAKLRLLDGSNAAERAKISDFNLEKIKLQRELDDKLFELRARSLKERFDQDVAAAKDEAAKIINSPDVNITASAKAQAELDADKKILDLQLKFNADMDLLEKTRNQSSKKNAEDRARELKLINQQLTDDEKKLILARIEDIKQAGENVQAGFELNIDKAELLIQADKTLSDTQKKNKIRILEQQRQFGLIVRQAAMYKQLEEEFRKAKDAGLVTVAQYEEVVKKLKELQEQIAASAEKVGTGFFDGVKIGFGESITDFLQRAARDFGSRLKKVFGDSVSKEQGEAVGAALGQAIAESYSLAHDVMNSFFDAEEQRIRDNLDLQLERIQIEKEQVESRAQSQAEIDSIDKQYALKKKEAERKAHEDLRRARKSEAKLALAAELANIAVQASQYPFPASLVIGLLLSGLALGRYALRVNEINREKFAFGGKPGEVPTRGGEFGGKSHSAGGTDFNFKGKTYNAEVKELAVVRTKNANPNKVYSVTGTQMQIASAANRIGGGINFRPGAKLKMFEEGGYLGSSLQPPIFTPSSTFSLSSDSASLALLKEQAIVLQEQARSIQSTNQRIDRIQVVQDPRTVEGSLKKRVKQSAIGTL